MPNRIIRDGILSSERVNMIADDAGAEVFYRRLLSIVDDFGRYSAHPTLLRAALYPLRLDRVTDQDLEGHLARCEAASLINRYLVDGKAFLEVLDFRQRTRAQSSKWPSPVAHPHLARERMADDCKSNDGHSSDNALSIAQGMTAETESKSKSETKSKSEAEAEAEADGIPLDEFFEERYRRHPTKLDRNLAEQYLCQLAGIETAEVQERFRSTHDAWIASEGWQWKGGARAPRFAQWILDRGFEYLPPLADTKTTGGSSGNAIDAALSKMFPDQKDVA